MTKITIPLSIILLIPFWMVTLNYQVWVDLLNSGFNLLSIPTKGSHLSLGTWATLVYLILFPVLQVICFWVFKFNFGFSNKSKLLISAITIISAIASLYIFTESIVLVA